MGGQKNKGGSKKQGGGSKKQGPPTIIRASLDTNPLQNPTPGWLFSPCAGCFSIPSHAVKALHLFLCWKKQLRCLLDGLVETAPQRWAASHKKWKFPKQSWGYPQIIQIEQVVYWNPLWRGIHLFKKPPNEIVAPKTTGFRRNHNREEEPCHHPVVVACYCCLLLVACYWLLAGCRLQVAGCWLLVSGCFLLVPCSLLLAACRLLLVACCLLPCCLVVGAVGLLLSITKETEASPKTEIQETLEHIGRQKGRQTWMTSFQRQPRAAKSEIHKGRQKGDRRETEVTHKGDETRRQQQPTAA